MIDLLSPEEVLSLQLEADRLYKKETLPIRVRAKLYDLSRTLAQFQIVLEEAAAITDSGGGINK